MSNTYLLLGRTGDLISVLPFLKAEADAGDKPTIIVSNQHSDLFDGVSYVNVEVFDGGIHLLAEAFEWARRTHPKVWSIQTIGAAEAVKAISYEPAGKQAATCTSFVKEMWSLAGKLKYWDDVLPLVFDRRNPEREAKLLKDCKVAGTPGRKKPLLLLSTGGHTSPFPYTDLLRELMNLRFGSEFRILELPKAARIYDLLSLYERAYALVAIDSAHLHLARAIPQLPVIALTNDRPLLWNGSPWMPQWAWCCRYHDFPERATEMLQSIVDCHSESHLTFIHVWNAYCGERRAAPHNRNCVHVARGTCGRDSGNTIGDEKRIPYVKDCLRMGLQRADPDEFVCISRPDVSFTRPWESLPDAFFAYRMTRNGDGDTFAPVADVFCARKSWWKSHLSEIPDLLFGNDYHWSECLRVLFQRHGAKDSTPLCYREAHD